MTSIIRKLRFSLAIGAAVAGSCGGDSTGPNTASLLVTTTVTPAVFHNGQVVAVRVLVTNRGSVPRTIDANACPDPFVVSSAEGTVLAPTPRVCTAEAIQRTLGPGESFSFNRDWINGPLAAGVDTASSQLPAGTYQVRGRLNASDVDTPPVTIQIVP